MLDSAEADLGGVDAGALIDLIAAAQEVIARVEAVRLRATEELRSRRGSDRDTADEVALAIAVTKHVAERQVGLARELSSRFPEVFAAMSRGELDAYKASRIVETALPLPDGVARELDTWIAGRVAGRDATAIRQSARYRVDRLDPDGAARRAARRALDRRVELRPNEDGMADLIAYLPAEVACAAYARLDALARSVKGRSDSRSMDEIRADVFAELMLGKNLDRRVIEVQVTVPVSTLLGASELPGDLAGYGWIPASVARRMASDPRCVWRRLLTDPSDGQLLEVGRARYRPPAPLDDFIRARDRRCLFPGCRRPAQRCDVDHNHAWSDGGGTDECTLCCLCRRHHRLKDRPGWTYELRSGSLIVTTPTGRTYHSLRRRCAQHEQPITPDNARPPPDT